MPTRMVYALRDHEKFVYHYTTAWKARDYILKEGSLRLSSFARTNDPKESLNWQFNFDSRQGRDLGAYDPHKTSGYSEALKEGARLACFSLDAAPLSGDHVRDVLQRGFARPRMWSQYGDGYAGVCLVFDRARLIEDARRIFAQSLVFFGPVAYRARLSLRAIDLHEYMIDVDRLEVLGEREYLREHLRRHNRALFFEKLPDWRDEVEWRILVFADGEDDLYLPISGSLVGIAHGSSIDPSVSKEIREATANGDVEHVGLIWKNGCPWFDFRPGLSEPK